MSIHYFSSRQVLRYLHYTRLDLFLEQRDFDPNPEKWNGWARKGRFQETQDLARQDDATPNQG